jgi:hypothetical protein
MTVSLIHKSTTIRVITNVFIFLVLLSASPAWADWSKEEARIHYLINEIEQLDGVFIRNGKEYCPEQASAHIRIKLKTAMESWFAPDKDQWTAELFIEKIASKSSISGKPYQIKFKTGQTVDAGDWLRERLNDFDKTQDIQERRKRDDQNIKTPGCPN